MFAVPGLAARRWVGADAMRPAAKALTRALGVRDAALGLGTMLALRYGAGRNGAPVRGWLEASAMSDAGDAVATVLHWRRLPRVGRWLTLLASATAAYTGARLASREPSNP